MLANKEHTINAMVDHWSAPLTAPLVRKVGASVILHHCGPIDRPAIEELLTTAETASFNFSDNVSLRKRMFTLLVEGLENVKLHTSPDHAHTIFAMLLREGARYRVCFGNAMPLASSVQLAHRVELLNSMDEADLREHYLKLLSNEGRTERGGAGLGLLTMARKSSRPMITHTRPYDANNSYLALEFVIA